MDSFVSAIITLALVMDGFGNIPLFIAALKKVAPERRTFVIFRELMIALAIMVFFLFCGKWFLHAFGIHSYSLSIAGGIILFLISINLVFSTDTSAGEPKSDPKDEPFIVPLAIPLVAGPAALSMVLILAAQNSKIVTLGAVICASIINMAILMCSFPLSKLLGQRGLTAIERLTGMILILMSVDMVLGGIAEFVKL